MAAGAVLGAARPQYGGTLRVEIEPAVASVDPAAMAADSVQEAARVRISTLVFESLTAIDADGLEPLLATSWQSDARGSRWRFRLRSGVVLHDRTTLETWQAAAALRATEPAWKVIADGDTIAIDTPEPAPDLPWVVADARHAIVVRGAGGALIGSGPFRLDHVDPSQVIVKAHEPYWHARPFVDAVQIDTGRRPDAQVGDLESGRADLASLRATDARRLTRRGLRVEASRPIELVALVFEPHRADDASAGWRRTLAATINRDAIAAVVLQGWAVPARSLLPDWVSGYARALGGVDGRTLSASEVGALPSDRRSVLLRVDPADAVAQAIGDRLAVDAREAGFSIRLQAPVGLAPRADARLVRVAVPATTPDRALPQAIARLMLRGWSPAALPANSPLDATLRAEQALLDGAVIVPIVHLPELYGLGERVGLSTLPAARPTGGWNVADLWLQANRP